MLLLVGCTEVIPSPGLAPSLDISAGMTTVLTHSGVDWVNGTINQRLNETYEDGFILEVTTPYLSDTPIQLVTEDRELFFTGLAVEAPSQDLEVPVTLSLTPLTWSLQVQEEEAPCDTQVTIDEITIQFVLSATQARSGYSFGILKEEVSVVRIMDTDECPSVGEERLDHWAESVITTLKTQVPILVAPMITEELGLNIQASGILNTVGANNALTPMEFELSPGKSASAISSRGDWFNFDLDIAVESGRHECAPMDSIPIEPPVVPLDSSDMWGDPISAPYEYVVLLTRQAARLILRHWVRSGRFCQRHIPIAPEQVDLILPHLPASPPEGSGSELSMNLQVFSLPEVQFSEEESGPIVRIFFTHARIDVNQVLDGAHIRLVTLDGPISLGVGLRFTSSLAFSGDLRDSNVLATPLTEPSMPAAALRSPLWGNLENHSLLAEAMVQVMAEELLKTYTPSPLPQPLSGQMTPLSSFIVTEDHLAFPFFVGATLTGGN